MIIPSKYENLKETILVKGYYIIKILRDENITFNDVYNKLKKVRNDYSTFAELTDILTFLFLSGIIKIDDNNLIGLTDEARQNLHITDELI